jgi:hypothetical protein
MSTTAQRDQRLNILNNELKQKEKLLVSNYNQIKKNQPDNDNDNDNDIKHDYEDYFNNKRNQKNNQINKLRLLIESNDTLALVINNNNNNNEQLKKEIILDQKILMDEIDKIQKELKNII